MYKKCSVFSNNKQCFNYRIVLTSLTGPRWVRT